MRLGGFYQAETIDQLEPLCEKLDRYGLSAIGAPYGLAGMTDDQCAAFGQKASDLGLVIGEVGMWDNLMTDDQALQDQRIASVRTLLKKAEIMECGCVVTLAGSKDPDDGAITPHPYMYSEAGKQEFKELVLRILDGLDLHHTKYVIEPWHHSFFYQPQDIKDCIDRVDHPKFGLHLDQMNMVSQAMYYRTTELINSTFDLLADKVASVHLKDIRCDSSHMFLRYDEVMIGDGVMDYDTFVTRLAQLPPHTPCFCEHLCEEHEYATNFQRLLAIAQENNVSFLPRQPESSRPT